MKLSVQARRCVTLFSALFALSVINVIAIAQAPCPNQEPAVIGCPDPFPVCTGPACGGTGATLANGLWGCQAKVGFECQTVTIVPGQMPPQAACFTEYPCYNNGGVCQPNLNVPGQQHNKLTKIARACPPDPKPED